MSKDRFNRFAGIEIEGVERQELREEMKPSYLPRGLDSREFDPSTHNGVVKIHRGQHSETVAIQDNLGERAFMVLDPELDAWEVIGHVAHTGEIQLRPEYLTIPSCHMLVAVIQNPDTAIRYGYTTEVQAWTCRHCDSPLLTLEEQRKGSHNTCGKK